MRKVVRAVEDTVKKLLARESTGHDWYHIDQVRTMALRISDTEGGDRVIIEIAALAHDVGDHKLHGSKEAGRKITCHVLEEAGLEGKLFDDVMHIIDTMSFSGGKVPDSLEGKIVQDADRLYALGAIGIARAFAYGGHKGRPIHDPVRKEATIDHFYEKLLLLKDKMNTKTGRKIAKSRHDYMERFLRQFYDEWKAVD